MGVYLITGAEKGIGRSLALALNARGETVIAACLNDSDELRGLGIHVEPNIDVTDMTALQALAGRLGKTGTSIDVLISNAGIFRNDRFGELDYDNILQQVSVNALGPLRVCEALRERLAEGAKVGVITSRMGSLGENGSGGCYAYRLSKAAANMAGINLFHELKKDGVTVVMLHPGMVATDMSAGSGGDFRPPEEAAAGLIRQLDTARLGEAPEFRHANGEALPW